MKLGEIVHRVVDAATRRLTAIGAPGQTDFAHVVSTNYSQYKMWYFDRGVYDVKTAQDLGLAPTVERTGVQVLG